MKYSELTDEQLIEKRNRIDKILEDRKNGKKRRVSNSELIDMLKRHHDKFAEMHTLIGGEVRNLGFADYLNFVKADTDISEASSKHFDIVETCEYDSYTTPYYSVSYESDLDETQAVSVFGHSAYYDWNEACWENIPPDRVVSWIVVDGSVPSFKYIRKLATKLDLNQFVEERTSNSNTINSTGHGVVK